MTQLEAGVARFERPRKAAIPHCAGQRRRRRRRSDIFTIGSVPVPSSRETSGGLCRCHGAKWRQAIECRRQCTRPRRGIADDPTDSSMCRALAPKTRVTRKARLSQARDTPRIQRTKLEDPLANRGESRFRSRETRVE